MEPTKVHLKKNGTHATATPTTTTTSSNNNKTKKLMLPKRMKQITQFVLLMLRLLVKMK